VLVVKDNAEIMNAHVCPRAELVKIMYHRGIGTISVWVEEHVNISVTLSLD